MTQINWTALKSLKTALLTILATLLLHLAFALAEGSHCHVLEQLLTAAYFLFPALPFLFTKVPMASTVACIVIWPFLIQGNDVSCLYNGNGYFMGAWPIVLSGLGASSLAAIATLIIAYPRKASPPHHAGQPNDKG